MINAKTLELKREIYWNMRNAMLYPEHDILQKEIDKIDHQLELLNEMDKT